MELLDAKIRAGFSYVEDLEGEEEGAHTQKSPTEHGPLLVTARSTDGSLENISALLEVIMC